MGYESGVVFAFSINTPITRRWFADSGCHRFSGSSAGVESLLMMCELSEQMIFALPTAPHA
jgi:hypothetical protein